MLVGVVILLGRTNSVKVINSTKYTEVSVRSEDIPRYNCNFSACQFLGRPSFLSVRQCIYSGFPSNLLRDPPGLVTAMFGAAGTLLNVSKRAQNQGKASRALCTCLVPFVYAPPHSSPRDIISIPGRR